MMVPAPRPCERNRRPASEEIVGVAVYLVGCPRRQNGSPGKTCDLQFPGADPKESQDASRTVPDARNEAAHRLVFMEILCRLPSLAGFERRGFAPHISQRLQDPWAHGVTQAPNSIRDCQTRLGNITMTSDASSHQRSCPPSRWTLKIAAEFRRFAAGSSAYNRPQPPPVKEPPDRRANLDRQRAAKLQLPGGLPGHRGSPCDRPVGP